MTFNLPFLSSEAHLVADINNDGVISNEISLWDMLRSQAFTNNCWTYSPIWTEETQAISRLSARLQ